MVLRVHKNTFLYFDICCEVVNRVLNFTDTDADLERCFFVLVITFFFVLVFPSFLKSSQLPFVDCLP
jgi:hypothetical protein